VAVVLQTGRQHQLKMVQLALPTKDMLVEMVIMDLYQPLVQVVAVVVLVVPVQIFLLQTLLAMVV
jgi:hypothetical protein|tara:strand:+ start:83 stop:277 length:195 start_codon:yes stop_codon:yes gene_type:complete